MIEGDAGARDQLVFVVRRLAVLLEVVDDLFDFFGAVLIVEGAEKPFVERFVFDDLRRFGRIRRKRFGKGAYLPILLVQKDEVARRPAVRVGAFRRHAPPVEPLVEVGGRPSLRGVGGQEAAQNFDMARQQAMGTLGYKVVADPSYTVTQSDFTQDVISMKNAGVKILFMEQSPQNYAAAVVQALNQQNFHPVVVLGTAGYSEAFVPSAGGAANADGVWLDQDAALYLGEDTSVLPADQTFLHWVQVASPGFKPDLYTLYGWLSAELFVQALKNAGTNPSRGTLQQQLRKITSFTGGGLIGNVNPVAKTPSGCYIIAQVVNGTFTRTDDPPTSSSTQGFRCGEYFYAK